MPKPQTTTLPRGSISHQRRMHWWRGWFLKKSGSTPCGGDSSPPWTKDRAIAHKLANAQAKTIDEKPSSKQPFKKRRGLLPVAGYYEWETRSDGKQPVYYSMRDGDLVCLAGLWESCTEPVETESPRLPGLDLDQAEPAKLHTLTLITTTPNLLAKRVHDRMLVIVHPDDYATWLAPTRRHRNQITAPPVRRRADAGTLRHPPNE